MMRPSWLEQAAQPGDEIVRVRCVGENVVAEDQVGLPSGRRELLREFVAEELDERFNASFRAATLAMFAAGSMPRQGMPACLEVLKEIAVVARDFDHEAVLAQAKFPDVAVRRFSRMAQHEVGEGGEIQILGEELDWRNEVEDLQQPAGAAYGKSERKFRLGLRRGLRAEGGCSRAVGRRDRGSERHRCCRRSGM